MTDEKLKEGNSLIDLIAKTEKNISMLVACKGTKEAENKGRSRYEVYDDAEGGYLPTIGENNAKLVVYSKQAYRDFLDKEIFRQTLILLKLKLKYKRL